MLYQVFCLSFCASRLEALVLNNWLVVALRDSKLWFNSRPCFFSVKRELMMMKNLVTTSLAVMVLSITAQSGYCQLIDDFEDGDVGDFFVNDDDGGTVSIGVAADPSGNSTNALWLFDPAPGSFLWNLATDSVSAADFAASQQKITADVTWVADQWTNGTPVAQWARWDKMAINSAGGWIEATDPEMTDTANPNFPGSWDPVNYDAVHTRTITWDFSTKIADAGVEADIATSPWFQIRFSTNWDGNAGASGTFWIDNIRLTPIPEPTSVAMLGLACTLALVRRR